MTAFVAAGSKEAALVTLGKQAHYFGINLYDTPLLNDDTGVAYLEIEKLHYDSQEATVLYAALD